MTKYEIISEALAQFDTLLTSSEIDDFETTLQENGLEIVKIKTEKELYGIAWQILEGHAVNGIEQHKIEQLADKIVAVLTQKSG